MKLHRTTRGFYASENDVFYSVASPSWDELIAREDLSDDIETLVRSAKPAAAPAPEDILPPIGSQEVWAAGVTYYRSRDARMQESKSAGGGSFYDRVYAAERPELFFKAMPHKVVGPNGKVAIRDDASWSVPEPELTLFISPGGKIAGYTIGNDMSSRDIEGENPLYLPQAKVYDRSCALGPCLLLASEPLADSTAIEIEIRARSEAGIFRVNNLKGIETRSEGTRHIPLQQQQLSVRMFPAHWYRHCSARLLYPATGRRNPHRHPSDWNVDQQSRMTKMHA